METGERYRILEDGLGGYSVEISALEACDDGEWKCVATSFDGVRGISTAAVTLTCKIFWKAYKLNDITKKIVGFLAAFTILSLCTRDVVQLACN